MQVHNLYSRSKINLSTIQKSYALNVDRFLPNWHLSSYRYGVSPPTFEGSIRLMSDIYSENNLRHLFYHQHILIHSQYKSSEDYLAQNFLELRPSYHVYLNSLSLEIYYKCKSPLIFKPSDLSCAFFKDLQDKLELESSTQEITDSSYVTNIVLQSKALFAFKFARFYFRSSSLIKSVYLSVLRF